MIYGWKSASRRIHCTISTVVVIKFSKKFQDLIYSWWNWINTPSTTEVLPFLQVFSILTLCWFLLGWHNDVESVRRNSIALQGFPDNWHARRVSLPASGWTAVLLHGSWSWLFLVRRGGSFTNNLITLGNHGWLGQFGINNIPSAMSSWIFCTNLPKTLNGGKA